MEQGSHRSCWFNLSTGHLAAGNDGPRPTSSCVGHNLPVAAFICGPDYAVALILQYVASGEEMDHRALGA